MTCGFSAVLVGALYPCVDRMFASAPVVPCEWSTVMRCLIFFAGIGYASVVSYGVCNGGFLHNC